MSTTAEKKNFDFQIGDHIVYPAHGVGRITGKETQTVAGMSIEVFVIAFEQDRMTLRVPVPRAKQGGMRPLASGAVVDNALKTLSGRARIKRAMWSRRAQEYEAKINSGDLISIAEVVRDLHRASDQPEQSYSERQLYESALDRMAREVAAIENIARDAAESKLKETLAKRTAAAAAAAAAA
jgi:CarD family transcriptional regulator